MTLYEAIRQVLVGANAVTAICGQRIRPDMLAARDNVPAITIKIGNSFENDLEDVVEAGEATVTLFVWSEQRSVTDGLMKQAARALKAADVVGDLTLSVWDGESDADVDPANAGSDEKDWYRDDRTFVVQWAVGA